MAKHSDIRPSITMACNECKERNYITKKKPVKQPRPYGTDEVLPALPHAHRGTAKTR